MSTSIHPYDPPQSTTSIPARRWRPLSPSNPGEWVARSAFFILTSFGVLALAILVEMLVAAVGARSPLRHVVTAVLGLAAFSALLGTAASIRAMVAFGRSSQAHKGAAVFGAVLATLGATFVTWFMAGMTVWAASDFRRGRQLRRLGRVLLPRVRPGADWATCAFSGPFPDEARVTAAQWRENGRTEHASVAAFAALTRDLMALGAPPALLASANEDALDEIRHTELCFSLARALDGRAESPGPFPEARTGSGVQLGRAFGLARLAMDSLVDGALHEGVSARVLSKLSRRCELPEVKAMLKAIARDEARHAAHGWDVVDWCAAEGGGPVLRALAAALEALPATMASPLPPEAVSGAWERFGIHGRGLEQTEYVAALGTLRRRVAGLAASARAQAEIRLEAC